MYPTMRLRRNRRKEWVRSLVSETSLSPKDLILPIFVTEGTNQKQPINTMPGVFRQSIDQVVITAKKAEDLGIKAIALFPSIADELKSDDADEAYNLDNLICRTIRTLKNSGISIGIICDVALDPYTKHGHDGILINGEVNNDETIEALSNQALTLAKSGADIVAPSDMMDGRIESIREELDIEGFENISILSYAAKYNSNLYRPFRDAVVTGKTEYLCKATYQMDIRNSKEAMREIKHDIKEGADMILIKPGMCFLDIINQARNKFDIPIFAYQVSGEYSMIKFASINNAIDWEKSIIESLICIKRAGASAIFTYAAIDVAQIIST